MNAPEEAVWIVDARTLRVVAVNEDALRLSGFRREALIGHGVTALAATPEDLAFWADAHAGGENRLLSDSLMRCADGSVRPVARRIEPIDFDGLRAFSVSMTPR
jgi:PAS domain S-box-containing protein